MKTKQSQKRPDRLFLLPVTVFAIMLYLVVPAFAAQAPLETSSPYTAPGPAMPAEVPSTFPDAPVEPLYAYEDFMMGNALSAGTEGGADADAEQQPEAVNPENAAEAEEEAIAASQDEETGSEASGSDSIETVEGALRLERRQAEYSIARPQAHDFSRQSMEWLLPNGGSSWRSGSEDGGRTSMGTLGIRGFQNSGPGYGSLTERLARWTHYGLESLFERFSRDKKEKVKQYLYQN